MRTKLGNVVDGCDQRLLRATQALTMNIVGQLAETVFVTVKELYRGLNPATLTGGIDVIVVRQPDGSFQCSPFHVRFGKLGVLRSKEKIVDIEINGESVDLHMKLGDNGEAFFVEENENMESEVPAHLCTSPIPRDAPEDTEVAEGLSVCGSGARRKKRRRKRVRSDSHLRDEAALSSDEEEREKEWERDSDQTGPESPKEERVSSLQASKSVYYSLSEEPSEESGSLHTHPYSEGEQSPIEKLESVFFSRPTSPKSDSELLVQKVQESVPHIQWNWGGFPTLQQSERSSLEQLSPSSTSHFRTIERQDSFDMGFEPAITCGRVDGITVVRPQPRTQSLDLASYNTPSAPGASEITPLSNSSPSDLFKSCTSLVSDCLDASETLEIKCTEPAGEHSCSVADISSIDSKSSMVGVTKQKDQEFSAILKAGIVDKLQMSPGDLSGFSQLNEYGSAASTTVSEGDSGIDPCADVGQEESGGPGAAGGTASLTHHAGPIPEARENGSALMPVGSKMDQQDKKRGKRNHHLGQTGIYLDDLRSLDPEVAALYFPKGENEGLSQPVAERGSCSGSQSPHSVGSGTIDSGTEYLSDSTSYSMDVSMSLCGQEGGTSQITKEKFMAHTVTYQDFANNPGIIDDPNLVICINSNYYNWAAAAPMILSMTAFQKNLPKSTVERLVKDKMPKKSGRWWFSWRRREMSNSQTNSKDEPEELLTSVTTTEKATADFMEEEAELRLNATVSSSLSAETLRATQCISQMYRKSLRLTSKQIEQLGLRDGANTVVFSVTTQYQGTCRCEAAIYLWNWDDRVIISDIDGTITKSDALGHILPQFGKDWTHKGIAKLYHNIHQNGYKFLYCSARAIGMAAITKDYLQWVNDRGTVLPKGPVLLAPSSLFSALHREVIEKKPEVFKIACLSDIRDLFNPQRQPFYAAFGNRTNDALSYKQVGVPDSRIFTVNPKGELIQEKTKGNKSSYSHLSELVQHFFPELALLGTSTALDFPEFSSFTFWRDPLPELDLDSIL
ncbi:phosphatidate phosphatase LPIN2 isoform 2-T2 [Synchiropus picturatus]